MDSPRFHALATTTERDLTRRESEKMQNLSEDFGKKTFNRTLMQKLLSKEIYKNIINAMEGKEKIKTEYADKIALAMKEWAISLGATHYCHWFQPLTGTSAEKHDAFIEWSRDNKTPDKVIEKLSGKQLIQGEPDASSFPSGGLRTTFEARGYTGWDPSSPVFVWQAGDGITLCIPSVFFSWTGAVLDNKIPLLRSDNKINEATLRLLNFTGIKASHVHSTLGAEQEYFVIDRALKSLRPDLVLLGKTVFGAHPSKGQELQDHYFGSVKDRILSYMHEFEIAALELGIPVKTRHNEVAPAQHEVAPVFEKASLAIDHNILLMELMRRIANKHNLSCLLHEKPFHDLNGSGKHCNWSLATLEGINLLDPTDTPENNLHFLILLTAIMSAVHRHSALLRASIGSAANDYRLGGHEAPPAILSIYLGQELENLLNHIEEDKTFSRPQKGGPYNLGLDIIPHLSQDNTDRNRTSPFAFTGNKFEFRAVGSSASPSFPITVINAIVAESLNEIMDEIESHTHGKDDLLTGSLPVLRKKIIASKAIRFHGDNYSAAWVEEAKKRGLPNIKKSIDAFEALIYPSTIAAFEGILTKEELNSRYEIQSEIYAHNINIEAKLAVEMFDTQILPAAIKQAKNDAEAIIALRNALKDPSTKELERSLKSLNQAIEEGIHLSSQLKEARKKCDPLSIFERAQTLTHKVQPITQKLRLVADLLEEIINDRYWPLPKYRELLYMV